MKFRHFFQTERIAPSFRQYRADGVTARIDFLDHMLRVAVLQDGGRLLKTWSVSPKCPAGSEAPGSRAAIGPETLPLQGRDKLSTEGFVTEEPEVEETEETIRFTLSGVRFSVERMNFRITAENEKGVLYRDRNGLAYNFDHELGDGSVHFTVREEGQRIFGLGDKGGHVNKNGRSFALGAGDAMGFSAETSDPLYKVVPFFICENNAGAYGLYYDTYSNGRADFGQEHDNYFEPFNSVRFEEENTVFYLILGSVKEILSRFMRLTGGAAPVPDWAFRYCGSTMEYTDAPDSDQRLRGFITNCREHNISAGGFYLSSGYTQIGEQRCVFHWNTEKIPSPEGLAAYFRENGMTLIPNVKPAFLTTHPLYKTVAESGWFLHYADGAPAVFPFWGGLASYLDFTNPGAYAFWKQCVKDALARRGYRNIWNDNNEYDVWDGEVLADGFGNPVKARLIRPLFSYLMARASREACAEAAAEAKTAGAGADTAPASPEIPFMVSRCAVAGTERVATTWTGDNRTDFQDLRFNHYQAMTLALSGFTFFGQDVGGFAGPKPGRELFLRWLQYGVFMPRFVLHSWKPGEEPTMPWLYPELMPAVKRLFDLRESLLPYLTEEMEAAREAFLPLIRPVFLEYPEADPESDAFLLGRRILACPVFDEGAEGVKVILPGNGTAWRLRGTGERIKGGTELWLPCAPEDEPVWFELCDQ